MPSKKNIGLSQLRVGLFTLAALLVLAFLILNATGDFNPFEKKMRLKVRFPAADGLREGAEVQLAGVPVGKVETVRLLPPDDPEDAKVEAKLAVSQSFEGKPITERIRSDSTARLMAVSVLSNDKLIDISPGTVKGEPVQEGHILESRSATGINQLTETGNDLLQQINKLAIPANEILNKANRGEGTLGRVINDDSLYKNLDASVAEAKTTMVKLQSILDEVKSGNGTAGKLLNDPELYNKLNNTVAQLEAVSTDLRNGKGTAGKLLTEDALYDDVRGGLADLKVAVNELRGTVKNLDEVAVQIKGIAGDLNAGKGTAGKLLKDDALYTEVRASLSKLDNILGNAQSGKGTLGKFITDDSLYNNLNTFSAESTQMIKDFRQNPKKYLTIQLKLF
jgi:phospholipid/cholesterol/gamma-HCH transport system substrate-binding protein